MSEKKKVQEIEKLTDQQGEALVPYFMVDREIHRLEKINKRNFILLIVVLVMLFVTNGAWVVYENQFEDITIAQEGQTDGGGSNYFNGNINGSGEVNYYGESEANNQDTPPEDGRQ